MDIVLNSILISPYYFYRSMNYLQFNYNLNLKFKQEENEHLLFTFNYL